MNYPYYLDYLQMKSFHELDEEVGRARAKFPNNAMLLVALMEEVGELAKALLQRKTDGKGSIRQEAIQCACVAMRIYEEGDAMFANVTDEQARP
jgi:NTP pyrophosphatase (non-canonical NTP hydrolase)